MDPWKSAEPKPESNPSTVTIFGSEYRIRGPADSTYGRKVAELVDARMREVAEHQRIQSPIRVAILTLGGAGVLALLLALSGAISVKASSGHLFLTAWMLDLVKVRSVVARSLGIDVPALGYRVKEHVSSGAAMHLVIGR